MFLVKEPIMRSKFFLVFFLCVVLNVHAQSNFWYEGKIVKSKGTCTWLIRITDTNDSAFESKLIDPTGDLPEYFFKRGTKIQFEMHPLRQPIPDGCKANVVASIVNPKKL
jgi:hypothetical protein